MQASAQRRLAAGCVDALLGALLAVALAPTTGRWCAGRAALLLRLDAPDSAWKGPVPLVLGIAGDVVYGAPLALLLVLLAGPLLGRTAGAVAMRIRVARRGEDGDPGPLLRWKRHAVATSPWWLWNAALLTGAGSLALLAASLLLLLAAGLLPAAHGRRTLHDRLAGTTVLGDVGRGGRRREAL